MVCIVYTACKCMHVLGLQAIIFKKDVASQCSLLPAPPLSLGGTLCSGTKVDIHDLEPEDEVATKVEESDTDYMAEGDLVEG